MRYRLAVLGIVFVAITQGAQFVAIDSQPASTTSLMLAPTALGVAVVSSRLIGESVRPAQMAGTALIVVGAALYFASGASRMSAACTAWDGVWKTSPGPRRV